MEEKIEDGKISRNSSRKYARNYTSMRGQKSEVDQFMQIIKWAKYK